MPQPAVGRPFGELHLGDEGRPDPMRSLVCARPVAKGTFGCFQWTEQLHDARKLALGEASAGMTDVDQVVSLVHAEQERAKV